MIIQIGTEVDESKILWKHKEEDDWRRADIDERCQAAALFGDAAR